MRKSVDDCLLGRENNFDFLRFLAALFVILSHAYFLTPHGEPEPMRTFSNGIYSIGGVCVSLFFIISGFLITRSSERSKSFSDYFYSRALRIYPALFIVTLVTVFVVGPWVTTRSLHDYFTDFQTLKYSTNVAAFRYATALPGVFENNPFPNYVNGSLWTLPNEIVCYCLVAAFTAFRARNIKYFLIITAAVILLFNNYLFFQHQFYRNVFYFLCGALIYQFRHKIILDGRLALLGGLLMACNIHFNHDSVTSNLVTGITLSYLVIFLSFFKTAYFKNFARYGDFSYGIYIWGFMVQQILALKFSHLGVLSHFFIAAGICLVLATLSWHLIEKRALQWKQYLKEKHQQLVPAEETRLVTTLPAAT